MMRSRAGKLVFAAVAATLVVGVGYALTQQTLPSDAGSTCATSLTATEFNTWFDSGAVSLNGAVKPANSVLFPDVPNCSFYKWSEQMFLWLTSPAPPRYGSGGLIMNTSAFYDVSLPDGSGQRHFVPHTSGLIRAFNLRTAQLGMLELPVALEQKTLRLLEIMPPVMSQEGRQLVADKDGNEVEVGGVRLADGKTPVLLDVSGKEIAGPRALMQSKNSDEVPAFEKKLAKLKDFDLTELVQKIVINEKATLLLDLFGHFTATEQGQADGGVLMAQNGSLVYYSLMVNNVFALYRTMQGATVPGGTKFPLTQPELDAITAFAATHGQPPVIDSEALAIEIKASWVEAASLTDASKFIQMKAIVPNYNTSNPDDWVPSGTRTVTLAMVGMHIVGSTGSTNPSNPNHGHPEMLWATFEHLSNGPAAAYNYTKTPSGTGTVPQNTAGDWVFCANGAGIPFNGMHMQMGFGATSGHILSVPPFHIGPINVLRTMPWGLPGSSSTPNAEVISINNTVRSLLDPADVRKNYFHEGTTWTIFGASPNGSNQVGTNKLENTTMETFNQGANCFSCHGTNTTVVSHVFDDTAPLF
ncbi:MAG TPA: hypothetical protein VGS07_26630 [Thermoanaerobaculia bacterium]|jgi:hypothetical protein|nr:hypothetical protein [Thermoanaerobaculia bacterium]